MSKGISDRLQYMRDREREDIAVTLPTEGDQVSPVKTYHLKITVVDIGTDGKVDV
jgi:hypothetical protein